MELVKDLKMILKNCYRVFKYKFWHNPIIDMLENYSGKFNNWIWRKRWADTSLYRGKRKKYIKILDANVC